MYGGDINDKWIQYGNLCVRRNNESNLGGNWYVVTNKYTDDKTINTNTEITFELRDTLIRNDTLFAKHINEIRLGDPQVIQWCEENANDFGIINAEEVNRKMNVTVDRYLTLILERVNSIHKNMSNYIAQIKNVVDIDLYLLDTGSIHYKYKKATKKIDKYNLNPDIELDDLDKLPTSVDVGINSPGIHLGDVIIQKMSGPVSTYYLRPTKSIYDSKTASFFPLLLLFGDMHRSYEGSCSPCDYTNLCYKISDPYLLKKIDDLSTPTNPIDFYTESRIEDTGEGFQDGYMEELTTQNMVVCANHKLKTTNPTEYARKCPTQNIRWQGGDPRYSFNHAESFFSSLTHTVDEVSVYRTMSKQLIPDTIQKLLKMYQLRNVDEIKTLFHPFTLLKNVYGMTLHLDTIKQNIIDAPLGAERDELSDTYKHLEKTINELYDGAYTAFTNNLFLFLSQRNSLIMKQINKQTHPEFKRIEFWKNLFKMSLTTSFERHKVITFVNYAIDSMYVCLDNTDSPLPENIMHFIYNFLLCMNSPLLDIYTMARILKQPEDGARSSMSICYFGNAHIQNMVLLFESIGYELVFENDTQIRCQTYTNLNLTDELVKHNLSRGQERDALRPIEPLNTWYMFSTPTPLSREPAQRPVSKARPVVPIRPVQPNSIKPWYKWGGKTKKVKKRRSRKNKN